jgi:hypothetical protein
MKMHDPFLEVIGISADGQLSADIDLQLYEEADSPDERRNSRRKNPEGNNS